MRKVARNDGMYYGISLEHGQYFVNIYDKNNNEVDGFTEPFETEEIAYSVAEIAARSFAHGQSNILERG